MPLQLVPLAGAALAGLAGGAASAAAGAAMDWLLGNETVETDETGSPVNVTTIVEVNTPVTVEARTPQNADNHAEWSINDPNLTEPIGHYAVRPSTLITDQQRLATINGANTLARTEEGRSALRQFAERPEPEPELAARSARAEMASRPTQEAIRRTRPRDRNVRRQAAEQERRMARTAKADRSRTSLEYHEWKHNCVDTGENFAVLQGSVLSSVNLDMAYSLTDGPQVGGTYRPPYYQWVKYPELREVMNLVKRYRRYWRGKNMPLLRAELGFATVDHAIQVSLAEDTDYTGARTILVATPDFE